MTAKKVARALLAVAAATMCSVSWSAATIIINNTNAAGVGFNDPTPAAPIGGNTGITLGQQRLNAFLYVANLWGATLTSAVPIVVDASFEPLTCTETSAIFGSAGTMEVFRDYPGAPLPGTWYPGALADKLAGFNLDANSSDIRARFNSNLGASGCLTGSPFYLGLDSNQPAGQIDLVAVVLHELAHGLGFATYTNGASGALLVGYPSVFDRFLYDNTQNLLWTNMTNAQRVALAINSGHLAWAGANVTAAVPQVLDSGGPKMSVLSPADIAGDYEIGTASFGPPLSSVDLTRKVVPVIQSGTLGRACSLLSLRNKKFVTNQFAMVLRGRCEISKKVRNAQKAGAAGVIVMNNVVGAPAENFDAFGTGANILIPSVMISSEDGITLLEKIDAAHPNLSPVNARLFGDDAQFIGADAVGRALMYTPSSFASSLSVHHWDTSAAPALLMQPPISPDVGQSVIPPNDLTFPALQDLGW